MLDKRIKIYEERNRLIKLRCIEICEKFQKDYIRSLYIILVLLLVILVFIAHSYIVNID